MKALILAIIVLIAIGNAVNISETAKEIQNAHVQLIVTKYYDIKIQKEIVPELSEITGRTYAISVSHMQSGFFVNDNGMIISAADQDESVYIKEAVDKIERNIVADVASIEHIKKFGTNVSEDQLTDYLRYFRNTYGELYDQYKNGSINVTKTAEARFVLSPGRNQTIARLIKKDNDSQIVQSNISSAPTVIFLPNLTTQKGDDIYIVEESGFETAIISNIANQKIKIDSDISPGQIAIDRNGNIVGMANGNNRTLVSSDSIIAKLQQNSITNTKSQTTKNYEQAVLDFQTGNYQKALDEFEQLATAYPSQQILQYRDDAKERANELMQIIKNPQYWIIAVVIITIGYFGFRFLNRPKERKGRKRGRYNAEEEEVDYSS